MFILIGKLVPEAFIPIYLSFSKNSIIRDTVRREGKELEHLRVFWNKVEPYLRTHPTADTCFFFQFILGCLSNMTVKNS